MSNPRNPGLTIFQAASQATGLIRNNFTGPAAERRRSAQWVQARTRAESQFYDRLQEAATTTDLNDLNNAYSEARESIMADVVKNIEMDSQVRQRFEAEIDSIGEEYRRGISELAQQQEQANGIVRLDETLEDIHNMPVDPAERALRAEEAIQEFFNAGVIPDRQQAMEMIQSFEDRVIFDSSREIIDGYMAEFDGREGFQAAREFIQSGAAEESVDEQWQEGGGESLTGLNEDQSSRLMAYVDDQEQQFINARRANDQTFYDQGVERYFAGTLTREWIASSEHEVSGEQRLRLEQLLADDLTASQNGSGGLSVSDSTDNLALLQDQLRDGAMSWEDIEREGIEWFRRGDLRYRHVSDLRDFLIENDNTHPLHESLDVFDQYIERAGGAQEFEQEQLLQARSFLIDQAQELMYRRDPDDQLMQIPRDNAPTAEEWNRLAGSILDPLVVDEIRRGLQIDDSIGTNSVEFTHQLDQGQHRFRFGASEEFNSLVRDNAQAHEEMLTDHIGTQASERLEVAGLDADGLQNFFYYQLDDSGNRATDSEGNPIRYRVRVGYSEDQEEMVLRSPDENGNWTNVIPWELIEGQGEVIDDTGEIQLDSEEGNPVSVSASPDAPIVSTVEAYQNQPHMRDRIASGETIAVQDTTGNTGEHPFPNTQVPETPADYFTQLIGTAVTGGTVDSEIIPRAIEYARENTHFTLPEILVQLDENTHTTQFVNTTQADRDMAEYIQRESRNNMDEITAILRRRDEQRSLWQFQFRTRNRVTEWLNDAAADLGLPESVIYRAYLDSELFDEWGKEPNTR